ncbi:hypothetical protein EV189_0735 [Motilibacter rhizosphaerae]|uniref:Uncharacterized protein n=1 Tax=Motilibacter rhizosphaerae TaxID=598652 RepID=A0A4Q7NW29_9ACTN|nr:hypothetical protein [Motilibacter rhizosphaerae]RZS91493.1 hypothetical protein EV189_0735 [Motilibacter rhizosphaerae]
MSATLELSLERPLPGWVVRLVPPLAALAAGLLAAPGPLRSPWLVLVLLSAAALAWRPGGGAAAGVLLAVGVVLPATGASLWRTVVLVALVHLVLGASLLAAVVGWRARVELAVVLGCLREAAVPQLVAQALALVAVPLGSSAPHPWLRVVALVLLGAVALLLRAARAES